MKKALIIGGGFAGCAAAHQLRLLDFDVTLVEVGPALGAGVRTMWHGGHPHTFGPRHFLTQSSAVYSYLNAIVPLRSCGDHEFLSYVEADGAFYGYPIHTDDVELMPERDRIRDELSAKAPYQVSNFEEFWIGSVGETLYRKFIDGYSKKMWCVDDNRTIDTFKWSPKGTALKSGPRAAWDTAISSYPIAYDGYDRYFDVATAGVRVLLNTKIETYELERRRVAFDGEAWRAFDVVVCTISPDDPFYHRHGALRYVGRDFHRIVLPVEFAFPEHVYFVYYPGHEAFTRAVEFKKFTQHRSPSTLIGIEVPSENGRYYPMPVKADMELAAMYHAEMPEGVYAMGRAGSYRYAIDIAACIEQAFALADIIKQGGGSGVVGEKWRTI